MYTRYQVVVPGGRVHNFTSKVKANKKLKALIEQGVLERDAEVWDCYNNPLSDMFKL